MEGTNGRAIAAGVMPVSVLECFEHASQTDVGVRRSHNQDSHGVLLAADEEEWRKTGHVFVVADGMGAHAVGELASEMAATSIPHTYRKYVGEGVAAALEKAIKEANAAIHHRGQQNKDFQGMGTTSSALVLRPDGAWVGHVGDSRVYRIRDGQIEQLSFDHSMLWEMARRQKCKPEEVKGIPSNVIVRSLGPEADVEVDVEGPHPIRDGDVYLACSDGLSGPVSDHELGVMANLLPPAEACQFLIDLANLRGGPDNITVIIVKVRGFSTDPNLKPPEPVDPRPWHLRTPWPYAVLVLGVLVAGGAAWVSAARLPGKEALFALAILALLVGIIGMFIQLSQEAPENELPAKPRRRKIKVYESATCVVEPTLYENLVKVQADIEQLIRSKEWSADWDELERLRGEAEAAKAAGDLHAACRQQCRAMRVLTEVLQKQRHKEEVFVPSWDKKKKKAR